MNSRILFKLINNNFIIFSILAAIFLFSLNKDLIAKTKISGGLITTESNSSRSLNKFIS